MKYSEQLCHNYECLETEGEFGMMELKQNT